jgi:hypothetical protein
MSVSGNGYSFGAQKEVGDSGEAILDHHLKQRYDIRQPPKRAEIKWKFDRFLRNGEKRYTVEYKNDTVAQDSGNLFIETVSNTETEAPGWALDSVAQVVCYRLSGSGHVLFLDVVRIRTNVPMWRVNCESKAIKQDDGSYTHGLLVPIKQLREEHCVLGEITF